MQSRIGSQYTPHRLRDAKVSSKQLSADLEAFQNHGGQIEKLGNTPTRKTPRAGATDDPARPGHQPGIDPS